MTFLRDSPSARDLRRMAPIVATAIALASFGWAEARAQGTGDVFSSSDRSCGYPGRSFDMSKIVDAARGYPNGRILILTPQEKQSLQDELATWNSNGGQPVREMAPCFNCSPQYEACIVFDRGGGAPGGDEYGSDTGGGVPPGGDEFGTGGGVPPGAPDDCPQGYTYSDKPGATLQTRYVLGFSQSLQKCMADQVTIRNLAFAAAAAKFRQVAAVLVVLAAPGVIDGVLHPPGVSANPNPYLQGREEGERLCNWGLKVSPVLLARCPAKIPPATPRPPLSALAAALSDLGWLKEMNPTGNPFNCGLEVIAVDEMLAGRGALPAPPTSCAGTTVLQLASHFKSVFGPYGSAGNINNAIFRAGDGARGIVYAKGFGDNGHYFNIVNLAGDVMLLDGQLGKPMTWAAYQEMGFNDFSLLRTN